MLIFEDYDLLITPAVIKRECLDVENVDENIIKCPISEEIASIKCEEIDIKDELDNEAEESGSYQTDDFDNLAEKDSSKGKPGEKYHFCPQCPYSTKLCGCLKKHMRTHSDNKQYGCTFCSYVTDIKSFLQNHMATHRGATKKYSCDKCSYRTNHKHSLNQHIIKHKDISEVEMHKCLLCPFRSKNKLCLLGHQKYQHDKTVEMYKCQKCSFSTKYRSSLLGHHLVHEDPEVANKFKCEKCPFRTKRQCSLKSHMKIHNKQLRSCDGSTYSSNNPHDQLVHQTDRETDVRL